MKYLRQNLVYCFQNSTRLDVLDAIEKFEHRFFSYQERRQDDSQKKEEEARKADEINENDTAEVDNMSKKLMRREARKS